MSRDYKEKSSSAAPARKKGGGIFTGILIGLILGLGIASGVAWYITKTPSPFINKEKPAEVQERPAEPAPQPASGVQGAKPRFDFYKILPGTEEPLKESDIRPEAPPLSRDMSYYLQAGSFQKKDEAENMKAKLAMLGIEANIQPGNVPEKGIWYRVRIGPYSKLDDLKKVSANLQQNGIETSIVKINESTQ